MKVSREKEGGKTNIYRGKNEDLSYMIKRGEKKITYSKKHLKPRIFGDLVAFHSLFIYIYIYCIYSINHVVRFCHVTAVKGITLLRTSKSSKSSSGGRPSAAVVPSLIPRTKPASFWRSSSSLRPDCAQPCARCRSRNPQLHIGRIWNKCSKTMANCSN